MDKFLITGGVKLEGEVRISGAKNAALPLLAAMILADSPITLTNVPHLKDVNTLVKLIAGLGITMTYEGDTVTADTSTLDNQFAPYELVKTMRASILVLVHYWRAMVMQKFHYLVVVRLVHVQLISI
jgi:UDP-N-acetylglucosamine 1-carboxyvinyltransferase